MYFQPYGDEQQLNLNWIINEIINLHKQLDPDYETPSFTQVYPYSNLNRLNLDWILSELKALKELAPEPTPSLDIQAVAEALVALPFDSSKSYQIYDYISRDGEIWRAIEPIAAGGDWDSTKWFKTTLGTDLAVLDRWINTINSSLSSEIEARQNADTALLNTINGLTSANISDDSDAGGATVKASLNNLKGSLNSETATRENADNAIESAIAIVANENTHAAIASGQYVYIKGHGTLAEGLYKATAAIPINGTLSITNVSLVSNGGINDLDAAIKYRDTNILYPLKDHGTWNAGLSGIGIQIDSNRIYCIFNLPFFMKDYNYSVNLTSELIRPGFTNIPLANLTIDSKFNNVINIIAQSAGTPGMAYPCRTYATISYD